MSRAVRIGIHMIQILLPLKCLIYSLSSYGKLAGWPRVYFFLILLPNILHDEFLSRVVNLGNGWEAFLLDEDVFLRLLTVHVKETVLFCFVLFLLLLRIEMDAFGAIHYAYTGLITHNERFIIYGGLCCVPEIYLTKAHTSKACVKIYTSTYNYRPERGQLESSKKSSRFSVTSHPL